MKSICFGVALVLLLHSITCISARERRSDTEQLVIKVSSVKNPWILNSNGTDLTIFSTEFAELFPRTKKFSASIVKAEIVIGQETESEEIKFEPIIETGQLPGILYAPAISALCLNQKRYIAFEVHGGGSRFIDLAIVPDKEGETDRKRSGHIQIRFTEKDRKEIAIRGIDLTEPCLFAQGEKVWLCGTSMPFVQEKIENLPDRFVWIAKADDLAEDMKATYLCGGEQPRAFATKDGIYCIVKEADKGRNEERIGILTLRYSEDGEKWETLEKKMPEIRCADYDLTVSPDSTIYLFACMVQDKPAEKKGGDVKVEKTPVLYKTTNIEEGWERIDLSEFEKVDVNSNFQVCFHKGRTVIAAETGNSKIAISVLSEEIVKETDENTNE